MLSEQTLLELGQILKEEYGVEVSPQNVSEIGHTLVGYFDLLAKIKHIEVEGFKNSNSKTAVGASDQLAPFKK